MPTIPFFKIAATVGGTALTVNAVWLNAVHVASAEGWQSPLVFAGIAVTVCAAVTPPLAERAAKEGQPLKAVLLWTFFALAVGFSLSSSIARSSGYQAGKIATAEQSNAGLKLAEEAYEAAKATVASECRKRGPLCRTAETIMATARDRLLTAKPVQSSDPGAERLAAVLGVEEAKVQLYAPLFLPLGLELGGFVLLALGMAPRRRNDDDAVATPAATLATEVTTIATAKRGSAAYYVERLQREFPQLAKQVERGELSCYKACIAAGLRKAPKRSKDWTRVDAYEMETA